MRNPEYRILVEFPVTIDIENNDDPFVIEGKGWFADELINWKVVMSGKSGIKTWLGGDTYHDNKIILEGIGEYTFLGIQITGTRFLNDFPDNYATHYKGINIKENELIPEKTYLSFKE